MQRRTRLILLAVVFVPVALLLAAVIAVYVLLQPQRITDMLRQQAHQVGLTLALSTPAEPALWPKPALVLHGITLSAHNRPVLVAARARVVLPWRALLGGPPTITQLELDTPQLDLSRLRRALARVGPGGTGAPKLPHIDTGIRINHGSLMRDGDLLLDDMHLETGTLLPDHVFSLQLTARSHDQPVKLDLLTTPHPTPAGIEFRHIHVTLDTPPSAKGYLDGQASWKGVADIRMALAGTFIGKSGNQYDTRLKLTPTTPSFLFDMAVTGPGMNTHLRIPLAQVAQWWGEVSDPRATSALPLPPVDGQVSAKRLDMGGVHIEGLRLTAGAVASSSPATASSAAVRTAPKSP